MSTVIFFIAAFYCPETFAAASVTPATGGSAISADTTGGAYTTLTGPIITEGATADIGTGTIILNAPPGFIFNATSNVTAVRTDVVGTGCDVSKRLLINGGVVQTVQPTAITITITITRSTSGGCRNNIRWAGIQVRPTAGTPLVSGNITLSGTAVINGVTETTNLGTLTEVAGAKTQLVITTQPFSVATVNVDFITKPIITVKDQFGNTIISDNATIIGRSAILSTQACGGIAGSGTLTSAPPDGALVTAGILSYTAMRYSYEENIRICFFSDGLLPALSDEVAVKIPADTIAPSSVTDLSLSNPAVDSITVSWTAPGDDADAGTATLYDLRYSTSLITDASFNLANQVSGEPIPGIAGTSESMVVSGLSADTTYYFALKTFDEAANISSLSNVPSLNTEAAVATPTAPGGKVAPTSVTFSGRAYPNGKIRIYRRSAIESVYRNTYLPDSETEIDSNGDFYKNFTAILQSDYLFALEAEDKDGRKSGVSGFTINLTSSNELWATNLFLPPTISFGSPAVTKGQDLKIFGYAYPDCNIELKIDNVLLYKIKSDLNGYYELLVSTQRFSPKIHSAIARQIDKDNAKSDFSPSKTFAVSLLNQPQADLNGDGKVNITDWSIFLSRWKSKSDSIRNRLDLNFDNKVDLSDLSIFLKAMKSYNK